MDKATREKIEIYLKKIGFWKLSGKEKWAQGKTPHMKIVSLEQDPPEIYLSTGVERQEAEGCGISQVIDIKTDVLNMYNNDIKKPAEQVKTPLELPPPEEEPPKPDATPAAKPSSVGESHPFICYTCSAPISAAQRNSSFKEHKKALCEKCIDGKATPEAEDLEMTDGDLEMTDGDLEMTKDYKGDVDWEYPRKSEPEPTKEKKEKKKPMVKEEPKTNVPAVQEKAKSPALSDSELDAKIEKAKTRRYLAGQGGSYKVSGKERPDSAAIQNDANDVGVSTEILVAEQTDKYAHIIVRAHLGNHFVDAAVHHDYAVEFQLKTMEIIEKNPGILDHYEGMVPVIKEGATIKQGDDKVDAKYYLVHALLSFQKFSLRDGVTKAMSAAQAKILNQDFREPEEIASEQAERDLVEKNKRR